MISQHIHHYYLTQVNQTNFFTTTNNRRRRQGQVYQISSSNCWTYNFDENNQQKTYELLPKEGTTLNTTKEFIFPIYEEDLITLPTNTKELEIKSRDLTQEEWSNIISPPGHKVLITEFMMWNF